MTTSEQVQHHFAGREPNGDPASTPPSYGPRVLPSLLDLLGLGGARAIANARYEMLRPERDAELVARLVDALARHGTPRALGHVERGIDAAADAVDPAA